MSVTPLHRLYSHYSELPFSMRILYTGALCILGMGYIFGMIYLFYVYSGRDGNPSTLSYEDLVIAYAGSGKGSKLESALRGPMSSMLPAEEANALVSWARKGADRPTYETFIRPTIDKRCMSCHDGSNPHLANLGGYDNMKKVTEQDTGTDIYTLVRVSHIHLFRGNFHFLPRRPHLQPCLRAAAVVQVPDHGPAVRGRGDRHQFLVPGQGVSSVCLGDHGRGRRDGPDLCHDVVHFDVPDVDWKDAGSGPEEKRRGHAGYWLTVTARAAWPAAEGNAGPN